MPEYQSPQPGLARHLNPVRLGHVLPELPWDNTLLLCFDHKRPEEGLTYCGFAFSKQGIAQHFTSTPFQGSPLQAVWLNEQDNITWREPQGLPDWAARSTFRLIPLTLFSGPLGFLLLPADLSTVSLNATHWMSLFHLLQDCLVDDLDSTFSLAYLQSIQSREDLVSRFAQHLTAWFAPCHYKVRTLKSPKTIQDQPGAFHGVFQPDHHLAIALDAEPETYELSLEFSSLHYREPAKRINLYREPWFALLKEAHQTQLQRYFRHLLAAWEHRNDRLASALQQVGERLEQVEQLLGEVKSDLNSLKAENSGVRKGSSPPAGDPDFCFYRKNRNTWVIRYHGQECLPQGLSSPKGMEAIRLLLSSPGVPFQPVDFDEQLKGFGYAKKDEDAAHGQPSPIHDQDNLRQLKELFNSIAEAEAEMEDQPGEEQFKYWQARFRLVSALYTHEHGSPRWAMEYAKAQAKIEELSIFQDDIFTTRVEALFNDQKKSPFEKYRKDAIEKSIRRALDSLYQFPDFQAYLRITIVTTHRDGFAPFVYAPDLWKGPLAPPNGWKTEP